MNSSQTHFVQEGDFGPTRLRIQKLVLKHLTTEPNEVVLNDHLLDIMLCYYDKYTGLISDVRKNSSSLVVRWDDSLTANAGLFKLERGTPVILFSRILIQQMFSKGEKLHRVNGLDCSSRIEGLQLVLEHELAHAVMVCVLKLKDEHHGPVFKKFVREKFGHTDFKHSILKGDSQGFDELEEIKSQVSAYVRGKVVKGSWVVIRSPSGVDVPCRVLSARGPKNLQAEVIGPDGEPTGRGWYSKNPTPYWSVVSIGGVAVPNFEKIYPQPPVPEVPTLPKASSVKPPVNARGIIVRGRLTVGAKIIYTHKGVGVPGVVESTRGPKNAKVVSDGKMYSVPYSLITQINGVQV